MVIVHYKRTAAIHATNLLYDIADCVLELLLLSYYLSWLSSSQDYRIFIFKKAIPMYVSIWNGMRGYLDSI